MSKTRSARFRELLKKPPFVCLGAYDAVTAKLAEQAGAPAIYVSGFVASAIVAGQPDFGVLTQTEMFDHIRRICRATTVPVFADADTGYGGPLAAQRTMELWEEAGASVLHLEDQASPKKCGHFAGKQLIPAEEMQHKLRAMLEARRDPDFFVVARTDSMGVTDLDDAMKRLTEYGADGLYVSRRSRSSWTSSACRTRRSAPNATAPDVAGPHRRPSRPCRVADARTSSARQPVDDFARESSRRGAARAARRPARARRAGIGLRRGHRGTRAWAVLQNASPATSRNARGGDKALLAALDAADRASASC